ncbi:MAG: DUF488 domain-containing protein [Vicinamibacterales bacterium]
MSAGIWTIGHSTRSRDDFLALLRVHEVEAIADVRRFPASRRHPHFNRDEMAQWLGEAGVAYRHFEDLGGRRKPDPESANTALRHPAFRGYADYMATAPFQGALTLLIKWAHAQRIAVMCAEAVWWQCHRSLIADALTARGVDVRHILDAAKTRTHKINELARIEAGQVCYPGLL